MPCRPYLGSALRQNKPSSTHSPNHSRCLYLFSLWFGALSFLTTTACVHSGPELRLNGAAQVDATLSAPATKWRELRSENFRIYTDYSDPIAEHAIAYFERARSFFRTVLGPETHYASLPQAPLTILLASDPEVMGLLSRNAAAASTFYRHAPGDFEERPVIIAAGLPDENLRLHWLHELAHFELMHRFGSMPAWLEEGLATYYSTLHDQGQSIELGRPQRMWQFVDDNLGMRTKPEWTHLRAYIPRSWIVDASYLIRTSYPEFHPSSQRSERPEHTIHEQIRSEVIHYAQSWLLVHMLHHGPERYRDIMQRAWQGGEGNPGFAALLQSELEAIDPLTLDRDLARYTLRGAIVKRTVEFPASPKVGIKRRVLSPDQALSQLARFAPKKTTARQLLHQALEHDHRSTSAQFEIAAMAFRNDDLSTAITWLCDNNASRANPSHRPLSPSAADPELYAEHLHLALWISYQALRTNPLLQCANGEAIRWSDELERLWVRAQTPAQWNSVARFLAARGEQQRAQLAVSKAIALDSSCWSCYLTKAQIADKGRESQIALQSQQQAIAWMPVVFGADTRQQLLAQLRYYQVQQMRLARSDSPESPSIAP